MPRLSLWREKKGSDYKFIDRRISEMFTIGGTGILVHKYLGVDTTGNDGSDATKPAYQNQSALNIQDLLFVENRDRKYDVDVYKTRGIYQRQDQDFNLSQFGIFLAEGTLFMTFHLNDIVEILGRRLIAGDVLELMHLQDDWAIDDSVPYALKRFYVVSDTSFATEGFSPTWYPHLWRVKLSPLVDSQEYKDILNKISADSDPFGANANVAPLSSIVSTYEKYRDINEAVIAQAEIELPKSGYNTANLYTVSSDVTNKKLRPTKNNLSGNISVDGSIVVQFIVTADANNSNRISVANALPAIPGGTITGGNIFANANVTVGRAIGGRGLLLSSNVTIANATVLTMVSKQVTSVDSAKFAPKTKVGGYLSGDGTAPNGLSVGTGVAFPAASIAGDYFLRLDYMPNRLFRFNGTRWVKIEDNVRSNLTPGSQDNLTLRSSFINDNATFTDSQGEVHPERQSLSKALKPKADN